MIVLKIIAIVIAAILGLLLLLIGLVLFAPIHYRLTGYVHEGRYEARAKLSFLCSIFSAKAYISDKEGLGAHAKILFFKVFDLNGDDEDSESDRHGKSDKNLKKTKGKKSSEKNKGQHKRKRTYLTKMTQSKT